MCMPAESAYWVTLSCSSRAMRWRSESSTSRCRAAPSSAWVACSSACRVARSSAWRVVRASRRAEWSSSAQFCRAAAVWPARMPSTERSVSSTSRLGGVHATNPPTTRAVEPHRDVQVPAVRLPVVVVVGRAVQDREQVLPDRSAGAARDVGPLRAVRARAPGAAGGTRRARRRPGRTPPSPRRGAPRRPPRRPAPAPRSPRWCAPARPRSAPAPGSPGAAAPRRCGAPGSSAACRSAGR